MERGQLYVLLASLSGLICVAGQIIIFPDTNLDKVVCTTASGKSGKCVYDDQCSHTFTKPQDRNVCSFDSKQRRFRICCPIKGGQTGPIQDGREVPSPPIDFECGKRGLITIRGPFFRRKRAAEKARLPFSDFGKEDIRVQVVGGDISFENSWPWMVLLGRKRENTNRFFCGGALINHQYVLTAAHCVPNTSPFFVRLGEHGISAAAPTPTDKHEDIDMQEVILHPDFKSAEGYYDVALIKLARPVAFRDEVKPVCLPWGKSATENLVGEFVTVTGWGSEVFGGSSSSVLREVKIEVFDPSKCAQSYSTLGDYPSSFPDGMTKNNIVCAGDNKGGKDACQGDSGGPMVHEGPGNRYTVAGVISRGYGCGREDFPGLYAPLRHSQTLQWIKNTAF